MQYAEVLVKQKTKQWDDTFTYAIPPELLPTMQVGCYVMVPFGRKKEIEGVVVNLKRGVATSIKGKIRTITRILQPGFKITEQELKFARWLAHTCYATWGESLFAFLPSPPRRQATMPDISAEDDYGTKGKGFLILAKEQKRWDDYIKLIKRAHAKQRKSLVVFPDMLKLESFSLILKESMPECRIIAYSADDSQTERWNKWLTIRSGKVDIVIGSRLAILTPPPNTGLLILDEPWHEGMQEEQSPRYKTAEVAKYWLRNRGITIVEGDAFPSLRQLKEIVNGETTPLSRRIPVSSAAIKIVDMNQEKKSISLALFNTIEKVIADQKSALLFVPHKGYGMVIRCLDCDTALQCPKCGSPVRYHKGQGVITCHQCNTRAAMPERCPGCQGARLKSFGMGTERLKEWLETTIGPRAPIIILDRETVMRELPSNAIFVATQAAFRYSLKPAVTGVIDADYFMSRPDFIASEEALRTLHHLSLMADQEMIIQTSTPDLPVYKALGTGRYQSYLKQLLDERQKSGYPPYGYLVKLTLEKDTAEEAMRKADELASKIRQAKLPADLLGPSPAYFAQRRGKFRWQLILKSARRLPPDSLRHLISTEWTLEYDPASLL